MISFFFNNFFFLIDKLNIIRNYIFLLKIYYFLAFIKIITNFIKLNRFINLYMYPLFDKP